MSAKLICYARAAEEVKSTWPAGYYLQRFAVAHSPSAVACSASAASLGAAPFPPHRAATRRAGRHQTLTADPCVHTLHLLALYGNSSNLHVH
jgi:hypothetical protein